jgi:hypothetical protein
MGAEGWCLLHDRAFSETEECPGCEESAEKARRESLRKHEATHGWRNPPSIYEEDKE